ncbi:hypothetical protein [Nocardia sp. NPDC059239]|uniref:hypothetical protein n=1 Tax=Nocardia sp. NPDC059239 TaxID=3346785 RepID=UPI0036CEC7C0
MHFIADPATAPLPSKREVHRGLDAGSERWAITHRACEGPERRGVVMGPRPLTHGYVREELVADRINHVVRLYPGFADTDGGSVLDEFGFPVGTAEPVVQLDVHEILTRAGLLEMAHDAEAVVLAVAREAVAAIQTPGISDVPFFTQLGALKNTLTVRMSLLSNRLRIEIHETREHTDERVGAEIASRGAAGRVATEFGGTVTWCELPRVESLRPLENAFGTYEAMVSTQPRSWT